MVFPCLPRGKKQYVPQGGPWPTRMPKVGVITHLSLPSRMLKPDWIGRPARWIHHIGGWNSPPSLGWKTQRDLLGKSAPPFQFQQLDARSSQVRGTLCPLPQVPHQEFVSPWWPVLSGHSTAAFSPDCGLCLRVTILGGEIQPTSQSRFLPLGEEHPGTKGKCEGACCLLQTRHHPELGKNWPRKYELVAPTHHN